MWRSACPESISRTAVASASAIAPPNSARSIIPPATPAPSMKGRGTRGMPGKGVRPPPGSAAQSEKKKRMQPERDFDRG